MADSFKKKVDKRQKNSESQETFWFSEFFMENIQG